MWGQNHCAEPNWHVLTLFIQFSFAWQRIKYSEAVLNLRILLHFVFFFCIPVLLLLPLIKAFCYVLFFLFPSSSSFLLSSFALWF
jgi:hypothetical protein